MLWPRTFGCHDLLQAITFDEEFLVTLLPLRVVFFFDIDYSAPDGWYTLDDVVVHRFV